METKPLIKLTNVQIFIKKNLILKDVNLEIGKSEFVYLIGNTGSGKSSLLKTLYGDLELQEGEAFISEYNLRKLKTKQIPFLRRKLGIVFQDFQLLSDRSVKDNLLFVLKATGWKDKKKMQIKVESVLEKVNLNTKDFKYPHQLSGGEQQRVAIARALLNDPELILADEPTGNLDPETSINILNLLIAISKTGTAVLIATHDHALLEKFPSRVIKCENGELH